MTELDDFASTLFEEAKRFLEKAKAARDETSAVAFLHAAVMIGFGAFEAHINAIADEMLSRDGVSVHDQSVLAERGVELADGDFKLTKSLRMQRLEDRVQFLCKRFSSRPIDKAQSYWSGFKDALNIRNRLTHPKAPLQPITCTEAERMICSQLEVLNIVYKSVYNRRFPPYRRGTASLLEF
jgi:hypothetical protein